MSAHPSGAGSWLNDLESDIRYGSANTFVGKILKGMGAEGVNEGSQAEAGNYMASPALGSVRAARGATELPEHPLQGAKDIAGGALDASQIPAAFAVGPGEEAASKVASIATDALSARRAAGEAASGIEDWQKINDVLGVPAKSVRIGKTATALDQAATMPGRALANLGYTPQELAKMTPVERMATIAPHWQQAGQAIDAAVTAATDAGKTLDAGDSAFKVLKSIAEPGLQDKAIATFNNLAKQLDIPNLYKATPEEALKLRRALAVGARFGPSGDLNSLASVKAGLRSAVSGDLHDAVPSLKQLDQTYSDLRGAIDAAQNGVSKAASTAPPPTTLQKAGQIIRKEAPRALAYSALGAGGYEAVRKLSDLVGP